MNQIFESFDPKESAFLAWFIIAIIFSIIYPPARKTVWQLIKSMFAWRLSIVYFIALTFFSGCLYFLHSIGLWSLFLWKDALFWFLFSGSVLMFNITKEKEPLFFFKVTIKSLFKTTVILEFIVGLSTLSFWTEFALIPFLFFFAGVYAVSNTRPEYSKASNFLKKTFTFLSIATFFYVLVFVITHYVDYLKIEVLKQFILPIFLTILFIPFLAIFSLYVQYEQSFNVIKRYIKPKFYPYTKGKALLFFNFNIKGLLRWQRHIVLNRIHSKDEILATMRDIRQLQRTELKPPSVSALDGWSPYIAKDFLKELGIETGDYWSDLGDEWQAISSYQKLGVDFMAGDCGYYIFGTRYVAKKLKLNLRIFDSSLKSDSKEKFISRCEILYKRALKKPLPKALIVAIKENNKIIYQDNNCTVTTEKNQWLNEKKGYDLRFIIEHSKYR